MNEEQLFNIFLLNIKLDHKTAMQTVETAKALGYNELAEKMLNYGKRGGAYISAQNFDFYSPALELTNSDLDINKHEKFDASLVSRCVLCGLPLTHKKSISIAMGNVCSGLNYSNEVDWNVVIDKLTAVSTSRSFNYYSQRWETKKASPKYYGFKGIDAKIIGKHKRKKQYFITIMGKPFLVPKAHIVYIPQMEWNDKVKIDENKRMSKNNSKIIKRSNQDTLLIQSQYIDKDPNADKLRAFLKLQRLINQ